MPISGKPKLVFFGNERLATGCNTDTPHIKMLLEEGYEISAIVTKPENHRSRGKRTSEIISFAQEHNLKLLTPSKLADIQDELRGFEATAGILVAFGKIIPQSVLDIFPQGIINVHPSLLPLHRGPTPIESVLLSDEPRTGVSLMSLVSAMDAGPVYAQSALPLHGRETKQELCDSLSDISVGMLRELLPEILSGSVVAAPQDDSNATYDTLIQKSDGVIDWSKPAIQIEKEVRAFASWPKSTTKLGDISVTILSSNVQKDVAASPGTIIITDDSLAIACGEHGISIQRLQPAGKKEMAVGDFLRGYKGRI